MRVQKHLTLQFSVFVDTPINKEENELIDANVETYGSLADSIRTKVFSQYYFESYSIISRCPQ